MCPSWKFYVKIIVGCWGTVDHSREKGVVPMTTYEALSFAVAFATLIVLVMKSK